MTTDGKGCVQCVLNQPSSENFIEHQFSVNETLMVDGEGYCHDYTGLSGKRYIALLQRVNMVGQIAKDGHLFPDEVNGQIALIEANNEVQSELADILKNCPAVDYECPAEDTTTTIKTTSTDYCAEAESSGMCTDEWDNCMMDSIHKHLRPNWNKWAKNVCLVGFKNETLLINEMDKKWFDRCCATCCDIIEN